MLPCAALDPLVFGHRRDPVAPPLPGKGHAVRVEEPAVRQQALRHHPVPSGGRQHAARAAGQLVAARKLPCREHDVGIADPAQQRVRGGRGRPRARARLPGVFLEALPQCELSVASVAHASVPFAIPDWIATCPVCFSSSPKNLTASSLSAARVTDRVRSGCGTRFAFRPPGPCPPPATSFSRLVLFVADSTVVLSCPALAAASAQPGGPRAALRFFPVPMPSLLYGPHAAFGARGSSCRRAGVPFGLAIAKIIILDYIDLCIVAPGPRPKPTLGIYWAGSASCPAAAPPRRAVFRARNRGYGTDWHERAALNAAAARHARGRVAPGRDRRGADNP